MLSVAVTSRRVLIVLALLCRFDAASAGECSTVFEDRLDALSFGQGKLDDAPDWARVSEQSRRDPSCTYDDAKRTADCEYVDAKGVATLVSGSRIIRMEIHDLPRRERGAVIGLSGDDTLLSVLRKMQGNGRPFPPWGAASVPGGLVIGTGLCLRTAAGLPWALDLFFDETYTLRSIRASIE